MRQTLWPKLLALALLPALLASPASAQAKKCDGYAASNGDCVARARASNARRSGVLFSQPNISKSAFPTLPSGDGGYRVLNQIKTDSTGGGVTPIGRVPPPPPGPSSRALGCLAGVDNRVTRTSS